MSETETLNDLRDRAASYLRTANVTDGAERTLALKQAAEQYLTARERLTDWTGRSREYRNWVSDVYLQSGLSTDERTPMQKRLAHHVGQLLHEKLPPEQLEDLGLRNVSYNERRNARREEKEHRIVRLFDPKQPQRDVDLLVQLLEQVTPDLTDEQRIRVAQAVLLGSRRLAVRARALNVTK
jgi:hypothetical protein